MRGHFKVGVDALALLRSTCSLVLGPLIAGIATTRALPAFAARAAPWCPALGVASTLVLVVGGVDVGSLLETDTRNVDAACGARLVDVGCYQPTRWRLLCVPAMPRAVARARAERDREVEPQPEPPEASPPAICECA